MGDNKLHVKPCQSVHAITPAMSSPRNAKGDMPQVKSFVYNVQCFAC